MYEQVDEVFDPLHDNLPTNLPRTSLETRNIIPATNPIKKIPGISAGTKLALSTAYCPPPTNL
jgi:hypothetical protein